MKKISIVSLLVILALLAAIGSAAASESRTTYQTLLSGETSGTGSDAHGNAVVVFKDDGSQVTYKLVVNGLDNTLQAHIHVAPAPGANGPVVLWLYPSGPPATLIEGTFNGLLNTDTATPGDLTGAAGIASFEDLRAAIEEGRAYVNVHTTAFPPGEIRGYLR